MYRDALDADLAKLGAPSGSGDAKRASQQGGSLAESNTAVLDEPATDQAGVKVEYNGETFTLRHGAVVIAAITSCTNTSNPAVMLAAGAAPRERGEGGLGVEGGG